ncbi:MAG: adenine phosphoribosyltransferase [Oscillatoriophycideae cyanobacterium NC_groundwater_1537_Pr4_S-0.65um_50_18]|nr:adenine phosphoribosyltransferase [Oscillatoriophycideae cyanobacterium NC_groundwater_1537_Pr4_S-0.65um_50_18]
MDLKSLIRDVPDFPKPGIVFKDITTLLNNPEGLRYTINSLADKCTPLAIDYILGIESRGFIFGMPLAYKMERGFVPVRKRGKLPAAVYSAEYALEYGTDQIEMHQDTMPAGSRVLIVDDLIATGGTAAAAVKLVEQADCQIAGFAFIIELLFLEGRKNLPDVPIITMLDY